MELSSPARPDSSPRISLIFFAAAALSASALSIVFSPPRCSPSEICSHSMTHILVRAKRQAASPTLLFPLWHRPPLFMIPCRPARQYSISCSFRSAYSSTCARAAPPRGVVGLASSLCVSRASRPPACNRYYRRRLLPLSIVTTTRRSPISRRSHPSSPYASATRHSFGLPNLKT